MTKADAVAWVVIAWSLALAYTAIKNQPPTTEAVNGSDYAQRPPSYLPPSVLQAIRVGLHPKVSP